jgi:hypothetical protein
MLFILIKPLNLWLYRKTGFPLDKEEGAWNDLLRAGYDAHYSNEITAIRAALWLWFFLMQTFFLFAGSMIIVLLWPVGLLFLIVWGLMTINDKFKKK